jgi:hypothetical protein
MVNLIIDRLVIQQNLTGLLFHILDDLEVVP